MVRFISLTLNTKDEDNRIAVNANQIIALRTEGEFTHVEHTGIDGHFYVKETQGEVMALCTCKKRDLQRHYGSIQLRMRKMKAA